MPLTAVVIDEQTLQRGSEAQRIEWDAISRELLEKARDSVQEASSLLVTVSEDEFTLDFRGEDGGRLGTRSIARELLSEHITEYIDVVRQIATADSVNRMEALDMAKKVTHDRAGRLLKRELRDFGFDLETSRRLFTLLLSLRVDTTQIAGLHGHRTLR